MSEDSAVKPAPIHGAAVVSLSIPCAPEYVGTARLTILGVASRMGFSYDQVEDIRLAVGEACTNAIERAGTIPVGAPVKQIAIRCQVEAGRLVIEVEDHASTIGEAANVDAPVADIDGMNSQELGALLMEILVDEVSVDNLSDGGTLVRLTKYTAGV